MAGIINKIPAMQGTVYSATGMLVANIITTPNAEITPQQVILIVFFITYIQRQHISIHISPAQQSHGVQVAIVGPLP